KELVNKITRHANDLSQKLRANTDKRHIPEQFKTVVSDLLYSINLESSGSAETNRTAAFRSLRDFYAAHSGEYVIDDDVVKSGENGEPSLIQQCIDMMDKPIADMSESELNTVWTTLKSVETSIKTANKIFNQSKWNDVGAWAYALLDQNEDAERKNRSTTAYQVGKFATDLLTPEAFFHRFGDAGDAVFKLMRGAQDKNTKYIAEAIKETQDILGDINVHKIAKENVNITLGGKKLTIPVSYLMDMYVLYRRGEQAINHMLDGGIRFERFKGKTDVPFDAPIKNVTEGELLDAFGKLTADQRKLAENLQDFLTKFGEHGNDAAMT
ncbi:MAG: hypothetical protein PUE85_09325, partial [Firmicutes bacterium]|nr:hypothetical protein [Bacillota bacterium]